MSGFDLTNERWIPVRGGGASALGFRELFLQARVVRDLALTIPPAAAGLWRILYAITYRLAGLDDSELSADEWHDRRYDLLENSTGFDRDRVHAYFDTHRFDLFDLRHPWLQDPRLVTECPRPSGINKLVIDRPSGSNQVWFEHFHDGQPVPLSPAEAAWYLIAQVYYGAAGRCATRKVGSVSEANSTAGPLRGTVSYHPLGANLFESLLCGLVPPSQTSQTTDLAPWERADLADPLGIPAPPLWPVGLLTSRSRHAVLLVPSADRRSVVDAYLTWAWREPAIPAEDPYLMHRISREGAAYIPQADHTRAMWRDVDALLTELPAAGDPIRPPVFDALTDQVPEDLGDRLRVRAYGFDQDRQTRDKQWFSATTPPVLRCLRGQEAAARTRIAALRKAGEDAGWVLETALKQAWLVATTPDGKPSKKQKPGPWVGKALAYYWPNAERVFWDHVGQDGPVSPQALFAEVAFKAIDYALGEQERGIRVARAMVGARRRVGKYRKGAAT